MEEIERAAGVVYRDMPPTPQYRWPLLSRRVGAEVWVKHENTTPVGAFKIRGGLVYFEELRRTQPGATGVIAATRGNHGQSVAFAARKHGLTATIVVPKGNSPEKNAAMSAHGAELIEHGDDFQAALEHAEKLAAERRLAFMPSYHPLLVRGVATYALELFRAAPPLDAIYVPVGLGSGANGVIAAREALGLKTEVVGVVARAAPAYADSWAAGTPVSRPVAPTVADGMACRTPNAEALDILRRHASRIVVVDDDEIQAAMRHLFSDTHHVAEGAGAAALAALTQERARMQGRRAAVILSGGNVDRPVYAGVLASP